ncbi:ATP-binding protein [Haloglomus irregulare]|jgi:cobalt-precorrin-6B (C15)-methyltransferase|uniref:ATP-binding protein n=1 Tax=Haloglomus irregulare TaxID=2234134 RepID=A0A554NGC8_9EURY|nr:ATP-binding protein [Haloglomus irregulare]TSD16050.1 ATP-binding protein [Haloglomus irregulare]
MSRVRLPHDAKAGPTKPEVRAVTLAKLDPSPDDHAVEVGACTGAVTVGLARRAGRVTALERKPERLSAARKNLAANGVPVEGTEATAADGGAVEAEPPSAAPVTLREAEAPGGLPEDADTLFLGGSRNYEAILDHAVGTGVGTVVMNVARLEVAGDAVRAFRERDLLDEVCQFQVSHGYELAGATSFDSDNPVYCIVGGA